MSFAVRTYPTRQEAAHACRDAGLPGWKAAIKRMDESRDVVAVLTSPDFNPLTQTGRMITRRGRDAAEAFARAVEAAKGPLQ